MKTKNKTQYIAMIALFSALAFAAVNLGRFIPNVQGFLSYDPKDALVVIAGFAFGPLASVLITLIVSLIEMLTVSSTGLYGFVMNVTSTLAFALPAAFFYRKDRSAKGAVLGLVTSVLSVAAVMVLWNWIITPFYMGVPRDTVAKMLPTVFLPFNLIKGGINAALAMLLYKPLITLLRRMGVLPPSRTGAARRFNWIFPVLSVALLAAFIVLFLHLLGTI